MLDNIRIVMIRTWHPGNIGSALRAMKTMGLRRLTLVNPPHWPHPDADTMAAGAADLIDQVKVVDSLAEAIADCSLVIGTSARSRSFSWPMLSPRVCGQQVIQEAENSQVALVFGQETMGMTNEELQQCNYHVCIPGNPEYPVLNVASAIQILCYEIRQSVEDQFVTESDSISEDIVSYPDARDMEQFYQHLEEALYHVNFIIRQHPGNAMTKLRRLFNRARPESEEMNMLRGILSRVQQMTKG
ncbi:tRNA (cytidine/uridine-2'-O-)-methyltransferase TrmJ [Elysia marginata]|uniref:tRNA (Cytidine/uridine-2'-O-)-methyltransferase TrmJ n=1 Tax=Elysia marginata TaxID=1093978 RepID=A0AAV4H270_9GAST|nr:tRNA (cytidine/uridine-2'-O-)-methyltransferase TrmJ [Elysia marginata]